jgi:hypothetical protein
MRRVLGALALTASLISTFAPRAWAGPAARASTGKAAGHPTVTLDRLDLSAVPLPAAEEKYLREVLEHEARAADWGANRGARIEYRFRLEELVVTESASLVHVQCAAIGLLPKGRRARGRISLGGAPKDHAKLVHHVLEVVAKSVITRLADIERHRRTG